MSDKITHIESKAQHDALLAEHKGKIVIIDFHASWCGPCHMIAPVYEKLASENPDLAFTKVDVDNNEDLSKQYGIRAMPTFKVVNADDGSVLDELQGASKDKLEALVAKYKP
ncbi:unnamed protein product [Rhizoctonia solani]|uniref:Thioredoxin n=1 Tax=Rhizoctonia solani TaxID=456999 RepID=A0A8H3I1P9_9AGAM|nr:unnamed protein product [Rhizoctonia solani]